MDDPQHDQDDAQDTQPPGERSGEGSHGLIREIEEDRRRKAGLPSRSLPAQRKKP